MRVRARLAVKVYGVNSCHEGESVHVLKVWGLRSVHQTLVMKVSLQVPFLQYLLLHDGSLSHRPETLELHSLKLPTCPTPLQDPT